MRSRARKASARSDWYGASPIAAPAVVSFGRYNSPRPFGILWEVLMPDVAYSGWRPLFEPRIVETAERWPKWIARQTTPAS